MSDNDNGLFVKPSAYLLSEIKQVDVNERDFPIYTFFKKCLEFSVKAGFSGFPDPVCVFLEIINHSVSTNFTKEGLVVKFILEQLDESGDLAIYFKESLDWSKHVRFPTSDPLSKVIWEDFQKVLNNTYKYFYDDSITEFDYEMRRDTSVTMYTFMDDLLNGKTETLAPSTISKFFDGTIEGTFFNLFAKFVIIGKGTTLPKIGQKLPKYNTDLEKPYSKHMGYNAPVSLILLEYENMIREEYSYTPTIPKRYLAKHGGFYYPRPRELPYLLKYLFPNKLPYVRDKEVAYDITRHITDSPRLRSFVMLAPNASDWTSKFTNDASLDNKLKGSYIENNVWVVDSEHKMIWDEYFDRVSKHEKEVELRKQEEAKRTSSPSSSGLDPPNPSGYGLTGPPNVSGGSDPPSASGGSDPNASTSSSTTTPTLPPEKTPEEEEKEKIETVIKKAQQVLNSKGLFDSFPITSSGDLKRKHETLVLEYEMYKVSVQMDLEIKKNRQEARLAVSAIQRRLKELKKQYATLEKLEETEGVSELLGEISLQKRVLENALDNFKQILVDKHKSIQEIIDDHIDKIYSSIRAEVNPSDADGADDQNGTEDSHHNVDTTPNIDSYETLNPQEEEHTHELNTDTDVEPSNLPNQDTGNDSVAPPPNDDTNPQGSPVVEEPIDPSSHTPSTLPQTNTLEEQKPPNEILPDASTTQTVNTLPNPVNDVHNPNTTVNSTVSHNTETIPKEKKSKNKKKENAIVNSTSNETQKPPLFSRLFKK